MEVIGRVFVIAGEAKEGIWRASRRQSRAIEVRWEERRDGAAKWSNRAYKGSRAARQHRRAIEGKRLRAEVGRARRIEHVHAHVISVGPNAKVRVVEEV